MPMVSDHPLERVHALLEIQLVLQSLMAAPSGRYPKSHKIEATSLNWVNRWLVLLQSCCSGSGTLVPADEISSRELAS